MMLKLKLQYFGHLMRRVESLEKTLMLRGFGVRRRRGRRRMRWLDGITDSTDVSLSELREIVKNTMCCSPWSCKEMDLTERLNNNHHPPPDNWIKAFQRKAMSFLSSVQSLSRVQLFATPWIAAHQASLSITNSRSSLRFTYKWLHIAKQKEDSQI